jgi:hypothetical protein
MQEGPAVFEFPGDCNEPAGRRRYENREIDAVEFHQQEAATPGILPILKRYFFIALQIAFL